MEKHKKFSIWYYAFVFLSIMILDYFLFSTPKIKEISYSKFRDLVAKDKVASVVIEPTKIYGVLKKKKSTKQVKSPSKTSAAKKKALTPSKTSAAKKKTLVPSKTSAAKKKIAAAPPKAEASKKIIAPHKETPWRLKFGKMEKRNKELQKREFTVVRLKDNRLLQDLQSHGVDYRGKLESNWLKNFFFNWIIPLGILFLIWVFLFAKMKPGAGMLNVGKSKAKIYQVDASKKVTFEDVAGIDEAVEEVKEVVDYLKEPKKYTRLGAKLPKGVLLVGPPGTGKTLLARAVAGEASVPFFSLSGSDFVEMFVGVGAARVRDLFKEAQLKAPCIIFIDELDAIGKKRAGNQPMSGGYDERENTLNQLLVEMDGFDAQIGVIIMGATNRPEVLDPALLRPGRFDRQVLVDRPDLNGREAIFKIHVRKLTLSEDVDLRKLAAETPGFAGAEIANVSNEAALLASRRDSDKIEMVDFENAIERMIAGLEKKNKLINEKERRIVAYHESGHAIIGHFTPGADPVQKVSIVPRGISALGYTLQTPLEDRYLMSYSELLGKIKGLLGGRAGEEVRFKEISTGASNDLERATKIAQEMITVYGMSKRIPNISLVDQNQGGFMGQGPFTARRSEEIERIIDEETLKIIKNCYEEDKRFLQAHQDKLEKMAQTLLKQEVITYKEILKILGPRPKENAE